MNRRLLVLVAALLLAGCGSDDDDEESQPEGGTEEVSLVDFALEPDSITLDAAGTTTFRVVNDGDTEHALEVEGNGIEEETDVLEPGGSAELTVELEEGEYELYCPVDGHRQQGMQGTLVVGSGAAASNQGDTGGDDDEDDDDSGSYP